MIRDTKQYYKTINIIFTPTIRHSVSLYEILIKWCSFWRYLFVGGSIFTTIAILIFWFWCIFPNFISILCRIVDSLGIKYRVIKIMNRVISAIDGFWTKFSFCSNILFFDSKSFKIFYNFYVFSYWIYKVFIQ